MRTFALAALVAAAALLSPAAASPSPARRRDIGRQRVFGASKGSYDATYSRLDVEADPFATSYIDDPDHPDWDPLEHSSGISPYHDAPGADIRPPEGCEVTAATFLIRHSCIHANDDEWEEYMLPFVERVYASRGSFPADGPLGFLNRWDSPITLENAEELTPYGKEDAFRLGKRFRMLYPHLLPPKRLGRPRSRRASTPFDESTDDVDAEKVKTPFKVWTASSNRDIDTAKAFIKGAFPKHQEGRRGEGDGKYLSLVEVPNKDANWGASLTPHKICPRFTKEEGKADAKVFLQHWGPGPLHKLRSLVPGFEFQLKDVVAVFMLCGYETVIHGKRSKFCSADIFDAEDWKDFEYFFDVLYHKMVGYASPVGAQLGIHWVNTSMHNLMAIDGDEEHATAFSRKDPHLPDPGVPPNATHTQRLFAYFTHREEPGVALTALGLWNQTKAGPLPLTHRVEDRVWKTSHVLPFLGHVALERISCKRDRKASYVRAIVNGAVQHFDDCQSGPGKSCPMPDFTKYVAQRMEKYGDFAAACRVDEKSK